MFDFSYFLVPLGEDIPPSILAISHTTMPHIVSFRSFTESNSPACRNSASGNGRMSSSSAVRLAIRFVVGDRAEGSPATLGLQGGGWPPAT